MEVEIMIDRAKLWEMMMEVDVALSDSYVFIVKLHTNAALLVILVKIG